jgi:hypothetical protein
VFKQSKLAAAVLAAVATTGAQAVNLANEGTGQVLIFPYYNTNNGFVTQISLTNTTEYFKAVKVRFRESKDSNDTLDFNIYFSPYDSWTGIVRDNPNNGKANIITTDETCTYPAKELLQAGVDFIDLYTAVDAEDTSEGYFEVIDMGTIADGPGPADDDFDYAEIDADGNLGNGNTELGDRIVVDGLEHDSDGMPEDCSVVNDAWIAGDVGDGGFTRGALDANDGIAIEGEADSPYDGDNLNDGMVAPTGGLTGYTIFLQASTGAAYVADATIIDNYATVPQHYRSDDEDFYLLPSLASGDVLDVQIPDLEGVTDTTTWPVWAVDPGLVDDIAPNAPKVSGKNPGPIAHVLNVLGVSNDYFVEPGAVAGATDWVVTFPMKKHGVFNSEVVSDDGDNWCDTDGDGEGDAGVAGTYYSCPYGDVVNASVSTAIGNFAETVDVEFELVYFDREEQFFIQEPDAPGFSPVIDPERPTLTLDREVNVVTWSESGGTTNSVLGTPPDNVFSVSLVEGYTGGWAAIAFEPRYNLGSVETPFYDVYTLDVGGSPGSNDATVNGAEGVPAIGFAALRGTVGNAGASGETIPHTRYRYQDDPDRPVVPDP